MEFNKLKIGQVVYCIPDSNGKESEIEYFEYQIIGLFESNNKQYVANQDSDDEIVTETFEEFKEYYSISKVNAKEKLEKFQSQRNKLIKELYELEKQYDKKLRELKIDFRIDYINKQSIDEDRYIEIVNNNIKKAFIKLGMSPDVAKALGLFRYHQGYESIRIETLKLIDIVE